MAEINEFDKRDIAVNENEADEAKVDEIKAVAIEKDSESKGDLSSGMDIIGLKGMLHQAFHLKDNDMRSY
ncbi:MAG: hypothetical protein MSD68_12895, partial [Blautia sp.]|uniref:hypothetical protein n=1 Tax=Blautia sp. TaxID=1955243 RepID=UPI0025B8F429